MDGQFGWIDLDAGEAVSDVFEVYSCMDDLGQLQLRTYDCSLAALRARPSLSRSLSALTIAYPTIL